MKDKTSQVLKRKVLSEILKAQKNEITEYLVYSKLSELVSTKRNKDVLRRIAYEEKRHFDFWKKLTNRNVSPSYFKVFFYILLARVSGFTFAGKLMENGEIKSQVNYGLIAKEVSFANRIKKEEERHEREILKFLDEERLRYVGSMVLGLNDALVELTGALTGLTFALQNTRLIAITGLITGFAASLSMCVSEYLSTKTEQGTRNPFKASVYTGFMYVIVVLILILPYFLLANVFLSLAITLFLAILVILIFTFYISVAQDLAFKKRFLEMLLLSLGVSSFTFVIGYLIRAFLDGAI